MHWLASLGLVLDIIGAVWVVKGMLLARDDELAAASDRVGVWGAPNVPGAPHIFPRAALLKMLKDSRRDAKIGAAFLVAGFVGQLAGLWLAI